MNRASRPARIGGFSLIELLVGLVVFATMAALAYGGLNAVARTRAELARRQDDFRDLERAVNVLNRDLGEAVARPVLGATGQTLPAFVGNSAQFEMTRAGFANPQAEQRSNLERVSYLLDAGVLRRGRYAVLDRAPNTTPQVADLHAAATDFRLRYLGSDYRWVDAWPPPQTSDPTLLPRAVQWRMQTRNYGEVTGIAELVSAWPAQAAGAALGSAGTEPTPPVVPTPPVLPPPPGGSR